MLLELNLAAQAPTVDPRNPGVETWRDVQGRPCAYGQRVLDENWIHFPGVASYRFGDREGRVAAVPEPGVPESEVVDTYYRSVLPTALQRWGSEALHGSAVDFSTGVVVLCAPSETGKSTLAYALNRAGRRLFADDAVVFDIGDGVPALRPLPFAVRLRGPSARHFGEVPREQVRVSAQSRAPLEGSRRIEAILVLERKPSSAGPSASASGTVASESGDAEVASIERLGRPEAFSEVLPHAYCFTLAEPSRKAAMMRNYLALVASTPVLRLRFRPGLENLPLIVKTVEQSVAQLWSPSKQ